jgi:hypothetical protein
MTDDDIHDQLVKSYLEYFKANEVFLKRPSESKRIVVRKCLSKIQKLAKLRRAEIMTIHYKRLEDLKSGEQK